ncbi:helix-turn-helix transcriptional regulator [Clostridium botulinum]|uniref:helix-turn-helix domain-containing protein n=1 Tax=Clostridium botulinum TaxID=1491 RepID=UPI000773A91B|nr:helix-turn-helix transcriptional regulator [Clostridium botulinum]NFL87378.1 helix-turn-helix transcriptional regulator [Clostridium botulinum]NFO21715.1 helix-turn-helix transcriptional regulator [Clostridium botulinum]
MIKSVQFKERLVTLRKEKDLTQYDLATQLGFSRGQIGNYEQGSREPDQETLLKIAKFFNVSSDYLLGISDKRNYTDDNEVTIALHSDTEYDDLPDEAKKEIDNFIEFVKQKYKNK